MAEYIKCNVCGSDEHAELFITSDLWLRTPGQFRYVRCKECGLVFMNPQLSQQELSLHYPKTYYSFVEKRRSAPLGWRKKISQYIKDKRDAVKLPRAVPGQKALDVGCGGGAFLQILEEFGWDAYGVEPFEGGRIAKENGLQVFHGTIDEADFADGSFGLIRVNHVLEHTPDPQNLLKSLRRVLAEDGLVQIVVPNYGGLNASLFGRYWESIDAPRHLFQFRRRDIEKLAVYSGFKVFKTNYRNSHFKSSLRYYLSDKSIGHKNGYAYASLMMAGNLIKGVPAILSRTSFGDEITLWMRPVGQKYPKHKHSQ